MILVDTSVWIAHLRARDRRLVAALEQGRVLMHPFVLGELACGNLGKRSQVLYLFSKLPMAPSATDLEALAFIEDHKLMGMGIGYIDVHLLASVALSGTGELWTTDKRLHKVATKLKLAFNAK